MNSISILLLAGTLIGCTTIHFRSHNTVPVAFSGNPEHRNEVVITGQRDFYFWGITPEEQEVFVDEEVRRAGFDGLSKAIIYEHKNPQQTLISFLTFGIYMPKGFTITGFTSGNTVSEHFEDTVTVPENN